MLQKSPSEPREVELPASLLKPDWLWSLGRLHSIQHVPGNASRLEFMRLEFTRCEGFTDAFSHEMFRTQTEHGKYLKPCCETWKPR